MTLQEYRNLQKKQKKPRQQLEAAEQEALFEWADIAIRKHPELKWLHHIPNGGSRHSVEALNLKRQGVKSGVADVFLPVSRKGECGLYIEMKSKSGKVSEKQQEFLSDMAKEGYRTAICRTWQEAVAVIERYLNCEQ